MIGRGRNLSEPRDWIELVVKSHVPMRLDLYLRQALVWKSRRRIQDLIRSGRITLNGQKAKPAHIVRGGDRIVAQLSRGTGIPEDYGDREVPILYEDPWLVAIDKPPGLLVHPVGRHVYDTLMNYLHYRYRDEAGTRATATATDTGTDTGTGHGLGHVEETGYGERIRDSLVLRLCHRIDKDTTGIVLVAKDAYAHKRVQLQFLNRLVFKEYLTVATGRLPPDLEEIDVPLGEGGTVEEALAPPLKPSLTRIRVLGRLATPQGEFTCVRARPVTGRQNQIRVHLAAIGHPIAGDTRYGGSIIPGFPARYLLHAATLRFFHPRLKSRVELEAPLPEDFQALVENAMEREQPARPGSTAS